MFISLYFIFVLIYLPLVSTKVLTNNIINMLRAAMINIVRSAVTSLMYGEIMAPTVPIMLTHAKLIEEIYVGNS